MEIAKKILNFLIPAKVKNYFGQQAVLRYEQALKYSNRSYAQEGEDLILQRFFENQEQGFYIDIGAHHPRRFSNTHIFYNKGWRGINIDAMPGSMELFYIERPNDINIQIGVSNIKSELIYYMFNEPALNTFSEYEANKKNGLRDYKVIKKLKVETLPLADVLNKHLDKGVKIDFMSIDVEGLDLEVLKSNDWVKYRPKMILVEDLKKHSLDKFLNESKVYLFLRAQDYELKAKTFNTLFFKDKNL